jgi:hypothetical protein
VNGVISQRGTGAVNIGLIPHTSTKNTKKNPKKKTATMPHPQPAPAPPTLLTHRVPSQIQFAFAPRRREPTKYYPPSHPDGVVT